MGAEALASRSACASARTADRDASRRDPQRAHRAAPHLQVRTATRRVPHARWLACNVAHCVAQVAAKRLPCCLLRGRGAAHQEVRAAAASSRRGSQSADLRTARSLKDLHEELSTATDLALIDTCVVTIPFLEVGGRAPPPRRALRVLRRASAAGDCGRRHRPACDAHCAGEHAQVPRVRADQQSTQPTLLPLFLAQRVCALTRSRPQKSPNVAQALWDTVFVLTRLPVEVGDSELVAMKTLDVLVECLRSPAGPQLSDDAVCAIMEECMRIRARSGAIWRFSRALLHSPDVAPAQHVVATAPRLRRRNRHAAGAGGVCATLVLCAGWRSRRR